MQSNLDANESAPPILLEDHYSAGFNGLRSARFIRVGRTVLAAPQPSQAVATPTRGDHHQLYLDALNDDDLAERIGFETEDEIAANTPFLGHVASGDRVAVYDSGYFEVTAPADDSTKGQIHIHGTSPDYTPASIGERQRSMIIMQDTVNPDYIVSALPAE